MYGANTTKMVELITHHTAKTGSDNSLYHRDTAAAPPGSGDPTTMLYYSLSGGYQLGSYGPGGQPGANLGTAIRNEELHRN